jgi:hypothetical protein
MWKGGGISANLVSRAQLDTSSLKNAGCIFTGIPLGITIIDNATANWRPEIA